MGSYIATACGATTDTACATCATCGAGKYVATACLGSTNTVCGSCSANCSACTDASTCTTCAAGYVVSGGACVPGGKSCLAIKTALPTATDGIYLLDPDGGSISNAFSAYCDMTSDGGGWMKILQYVNTPYTPTAAAVGTIAVSGISAMAKLSDANVNSISVISTTREYRVSGPTASGGKKVFMKLSTNWDDTARGHGLIPTGTGLACESATNCTYVSVTCPGGRPTPDTNDWTPSSIGGANNQDRYFTDYSAPINCYSTGSITQRCWSTGNSLGHVIIPNLSIWAREVLP
jgi:hypothetical protein